MPGWNVTDAPTVSVASDIGTVNAGLNTNKAAGDGWTEKGDLVEWVGESGEDDQLQLGPEISGEVT